MADAVIARRLLIAGGGGSFTPPVTTTTYTVTASPEGGWAAIQYARSATHAGYTYTAFVNGTSGALQVVVTTNATKITGSPIALHTFSVDDHDNPALLVEASTHKLWAAYCQHDGSDMYLRISTNSLDSDPTLSGGFGAEVGLNAQLAGWADFTYPNLFQLTSEASSPVYLLYREVHTNGRLAWSYTTNLGVTWSARSVLYGGAGSDVPYWNIGSNDTDRIDILTSDGVGSTGGQNMLHCYYTAGNFRKSDGTLIGAAPAPGVDLSMTPASLTTVLTNAAGDCDRSFGVCWDGSAPAGLIWQKNGGSDRRIVSARWRSGAWQINTVVNAVGGFLAGNQFQSGTAIHPTNPNTVLAAKLVGSHWEMFEEVSPDDGVTWTETQLTSGSTADNFNPAFAHAPTTGFTGVWCYGTFTNDTTFSLGMVGWG